MKTVVIDEDGVEITGFIHADNYFELYVNGRFVARDSIPMTPFNSSVVRFKARYPMTYAIKGVDWETHLGVGMEYAAFNIGDAGFIAYFSDGNGTARGLARGDLLRRAARRPALRPRVRHRPRFDLLRARRAADVRPEGSGHLQALHFPIPSDWTSPRFSDARWPAAIIWPPTR